ncbi:MAG: hypothetical protein CMJ81_16075 [Planctomycetaceae bacterium]|nr:hypothetical protein [Planctomycetaceae bacterium]MBP62259.1 hypothetical protein [Planctomycetaceae bacterium]
MFLRFDDKVCRQFKRKSQASLGVVGIPPVVREVLLWWGQGRRSGSTALVFLNERQQKGNPRR